MSILFKGFSPKKVKKAKKLAHRAAKKGPDYGSKNPYRHRLAEHCLMVSLQDAEDYLTYEILKGWISKNSRH